MKQLNIDPRFYLIIRGVSITSVEDILIELITNSVDAYKNIGSINGKIEINVLDRKLKIRDYARGMSALEVDKYVLTVGSSDSTSSSRGFVGRGLKDITSLGDLKIKTIRNNKLTECIILSNMDTDLKERDVTDEDRKELNMPENGFDVEVDLSKNVVCPDSESLYKTISFSTALRKINMSDFEVLVNNNLCRYVFPEGKLLVETKFKVEGYPEAEAEFTLYKSEKKIEDYGILVSSKNTVYESGSMYARGSGYIQDYKTRSNFHYLYGELKCDYLDTIARQLNTEGATLKNPFLVFDPNRREGLNKNHPFVVSLFKIPYSWISIAMNKIDDHSDIDIDLNIEDVFNDTISYLNENLADEEEFFTWRSKQDDVFLMNSLQALDVKVDDYLEIPKEKKARKITYQYSLSIANNNHIPYEILHMNDKILVKINVNDASLRPFINLEDKKVEIKSQTAKVVLATIIRDSVLELKVRSELLKGGSDINTDHLNAVKGLEIDARQDLYSKFETLFRKLSE